MSEDNYFALKFTAEFTDCTVMARENESKMADICAAYTMVQVSDCNYLLFYPQLISNGETLPTQCTGKLIQDGCHLWRLAAWASLTD